MTATASRGRKASSLATTPATRGPAHVANVMTSCI